MRIKRQKTSENRSSFSCNIGNTAAFGIEIDIQLAMERVEEKKLILASEELEARTFEKYPFIRFKWFYESFAFCVF